MAPQFSFNKDPMLRQLLTAQEQEVAASVAASDKCLLGEQPTHTRADVHSSSKSQSCMQMKTQWLKPSYSGGPP